MKKSKIFAVLICVIIISNVLCGCSKDINTNDVSDTVLNGELYLSSKKAVVNGSYSKITTTKYDEYGRITEKSVYNSYYEETTDITTYEYDDKGRLVSEIFKSTVMENDSYSYTMEYTDNENGSVGTSSLYNDISFRDLGFKERYYDLDNNLIKEIYYDGDEIKNVYEFEYHENGKMKSESRTYDFDITLTATSETYEATQYIKSYDENGNHIETVGKTVYSDGTYDILFVEDHTSSSDIPGVVAYYCSEFSGMEPTVDVAENGDRTTEIEWIKINDDQYKMCVYDASNLYDTDDYILINLNEEGKINDTVESIGNYETTYTFEYDDNGNLITISYSNGQTSGYIEYTWTSK